VAEDWARTVVHWEIYAKDQDKMRKQSVSNGFFRCSGTGTGPNKGMELTTYSVRSYVAPASSRSSYPALI
jgi:hypothetical protein